MNTANKMESHAEPGRIQVSGPAREQLVGDYSFEQRGTVEVKGMGKVETWWLTGRADSAPKRVPILSQLNPHSLSVSSLKCLAPPRQATATLATSATNSV